MSTEAQRQAREARETELLGMLETGNGRFDLLDLFQQTGIELPYEADLQSELIPAILSYEFPESSDAGGEPPSDSGDGLGDLRRAYPR